MLEFLVITFIGGAFLLFLALIIRGGAYQKGYQDAVDDYYVFKSDGEKAEQIVGERKGGKNGHR